MHQVLKDRHLVRELLFHLLRLRRLCLQFLLDEIPDLLPYYYLYHHHQSRLLLLPLVLEHWQLSRHKNQI
jgi:hypothetical protein